MVPARAATALRVTVDADVLVVAAGVRLTVVRPVVAARAVVAAALRVGAALRAVVTLRAVVERVAVV